MSKPGPITAWSYSRLACYETCPRQFRYRYVDKLPEPKSPAMDRGILIHEALEAYVKAKAPVKLPPGFHHLKPELNLLRKAGAIAERELAFDRDWRPMSWFDRNVYVRIKIDVSVSVGHRRRKTIDYKTGQAKPEKHTEQLELYAVAEYYATPVQPEAVETGVWYVDHHSQPLMLGITSGQREFLRLRQAWETRANRLLTDRKFVPRPIPSRCKWCPYSGLKGGPCEAG